MPNGDARRRVRRQRQRVRGVPGRHRVLAWADKRDLRTPILHAIDQGILGGAPPEQLLHQLMTMPHA